MFKKRISAEEHAISLVQSYASKLGIERRQSVRVRYPEPYLSSLPSVFYGEKKLRVNDMSVGGCCLIDEQEHLGPSAGVEVQLRLIWPEGERVVRARIVAYVHIRRHIQFLDPAPEMVQAIKSALAPGVLGLTMKPLIEREAGQLALHASEVWTSMNGESLVFLDDIHVAAELHLQGHDFRFMRDAWPVTRKNQPATPLETENIIVFLENIPQPSPAILSLKSQLQTLNSEGRS